MILILFLLKSSLKFSEVTLKYRNLISFRKKNSWLIVEFFRQIKGDDTVYEMQHDTKIPIRWTAPESIRDQIFRQVGEMMKDC